MFKTRKITFLFLLTALLAWPELWPHPDGYDGDLSVDEILTRVTDYPQDVQGKQSEVALNALAKALRNDPNNVLGGALNLNKLNSALAAMSPEHRAIATKAILLGKDGDGNSVFTDTQVKGPLDLTGPIKGNRTDVAKKQDATIDANLKGSAELTSAMEKLKTNPRDNDAAKEFGEALAARYGGAGAFDSSRAQAYMNTLKGDVRAIADRALVKAVASDPKILGDKPKGTLQKLVKVDIPGSTTRDAKIVDAESGDLQKALANADAALNKARPNEAGPQGELDKFQGGDLAKARDPDQTTALIQAMKKAFKKGANDEFDAAAAKKFYEGQPSEKQLALKRAFLKSDLPDSIMKELGFTGLTTNRNDALLAVDKEINKKLPQDDIAAKVADLGIADAKDAAKAKVLGVEIRNAFKKGKSDLFDPDAAKAFYEKLPDTQKLVFQKALLANTDISDTLLRDAGALGAFENRKSALEAVDGKINKRLPTSELDAAVKAYKLATDEKTKAEAMETLQSAMRSRLSRNGQLSGQEVKDYAKKLGSDPGADAIKFAMAKDPELAKDKAAFKQQLKDAGLDSDPKKVEAEALKNLKHAKPQLAVERARANLGADFDPKNKGLAEEIARDILVGFQDSKGNLDSKELEKALKKMDSDTANIVRNAVVNQEIMNPAQMKDAGIIGPKEDLAKAKQRIDDQVKAQAEKLKSAKTSAKGVADAEDAYFKDMADEAKSAPDVRDRGQTPQEQLPFLASPVPNPKEPANITHSVSDVFRPLSSDPSPAPSLSEMASSRSSSASSDSSDGSSSSMKSEISRWTLPSGSSASSFQSDGGGDTPPNFDRSLSRDSLADVAGLMADNGSFDGGQPSRRVASGLSSDDSSTTLEVDDGASSRPRSPGAQTPRGSEASEGSGSFYEPGTPISRAFSGSGSFQRVDSADLDAESTGNDSAIAKALVANDAPKGDSTVARAEQVEADGEAAKSMQARLDAGAGGSSINDQSTRLGIPAPDGDEGSVIAGPRQSPPPFNNFGAPLQSDSARTITGALVPEPSSSFYGPPRVGTEGVDSVGSEKLGGLAKEVGQAPKVPTAKAATPGAGLDSALKQRIERYSGRKKGSSAGLGVLATGVLAPVAAPIIHSYRKKDRQKKLIKEAEDAKEKLETLKTAGKETAFDRLMEAYGLDVEKDGKAKKFLGITTKEAKSGTERGVGKLARLLASAEDNTEKDNLIEGIERLTKQAYGERDENGKIKKGTEPKDPDRQKRAQAQLAELVKLYSGELDADGKIKKGTAKIGGSDDIQLARALQNAMGIPKAKQVTSQKQLAGGKADIRRSLALKSKYYQEKSAAEQLPENEREAALEEARKLRDQSNEAAEKAANPGFWSRAFGAVFGGGEKVDAETGKTVAQESAWSRFKGLLGFKKDEKIEVDWDSGPKKPADVPDDGGDKVPPPASDSFRASDQNNVPPPVSPGDPLSKTMKGIPFDGPEKVDAAVGGPDRVDAANDPKERDAAVQADLDSKRSLVSDDLASRLANTARSMQNEKTMEAQKLTDSATQIQRMWRGKKGREVAAAKKAELEMAAFGPMERSFNVEAPPSYSFRQLSRADGDDGPAPSIERVQSELLDKIFDPDGPARLTGAEISAAGSFRGVVPGPSQSIPDLSAKTFDIPRPIKTDKIVGPKQLLAGRQSKFMKDRAERLAANSAAKDQATALAEQPRAKATPANTNSVGGRLRVKRAEGPTEKRVSEMKLRPATESSQPDRPSAPEAGALRPRMADLARQVNAAAKAQAALKGSRKPGSPATSDARPQQSPVVSFERLQVDTSVADKNKASQASQLEKKLAAKRAKKSNNQVTPSRKGDPNLGDSSQTDAASDKTPGEQPTAPRTSAPVGDASKPATPAGDKKPGKPDVEKYQAPVQDLGTFRRAPAKANFKNTPKKALVFQEEDSGSETVQLFVGKTSGADFPRPKTPTPKQPVSPPIPPPAADKKPSEPSDTQKAAKQAQADAEEDAAARKIQAAARGFLARKTLREKDTQTDPEPNKPAPSLADIFKDSGGLGALPGSFSEKDIDELRANSEAAAVKAKEQETEIEQLKAQLAEAEKAQSPEAEKAKQTAQDEAVKKAVAKVQAEQAAALEAAEAEKQKEVDAEKKRASDAEAEAMKTPLAKNLQTSKVVTSSEALRKAKAHSEKITAPLQAEIEALQAKLAEAEKAQSPEAEKAKQTAQDEAVKKAVEDAVAQVKAEQAAALEAAEAEKQKEVDAERAKTDAAKKKAAGEMFKGAFRGTQLQKARDEADAQKKLTAEKQKEVDAEKKRASDAEAEAMKTPLAKNLQTSKVVTSSEALSKAKAHSEKITAPLQAEIEALKAKLADAEKQKSGADKAAKKQAKKLEAIKRGNTAPVAVANADKARLEAQDAMNDELARRQAIYAGKAAATAETEAALAATLKAEARPADAEPVQAPDLDALQKQLDEGVKKIIAELDDLTERGKVLPGEIKKLEDKINNKNRKVYAADPAENASKKAAGLKRLQDDLAKLKKEQGQLDGKKSALETQKEQLKKDLSANIAQAKIDLAKIAARQAAVGSQGLTSDKDRVQGTLEKLIPRQVEQLAAIKNQSDYDNAAPAAKRRFDAIAKEKGLSGNDKFSGIQDLLTGEQRRRGVPIADSPRPPSLADSSTSTPSSTRTDAGAAPPGQTTSPADSSASRASTPSSTKTDAAPAPPRPQSPSSIPLPSSRPQSPSRVPPPLPGVGSRPGSGNSKLPPPQKIPPPVRPATAPGARPPTPPAIPGSLIASILGGANTEGARTANSNNQKGQMSAVDELKASGGIDGLLKEQEILAAKAKKQGTTPLDLALKASAGNFSQLQGPALPDVSFSTLKAASVAEPTLGALKTRTPEKEVKFAQQSGRVAPVNVDTVRQQDAEAQKLAAMKQASPAMTDLVTATVRRPGTAQQTRYDELQVIDGLKMRPRRPGTAPDQKGIGAQANRRKVANDDASGMAPANRVRDTVQRTQQQNRPRSSRSGPR